jgi:hypothetical protein
MEGRAFRTPESIEAERITRPMIAPFLRSKGYTHLVDSYNLAKQTQSQLIQAIDPRKAVLASTSRKGERGLFLLCGSALLQDQGR